MSDKKKEVILYRGRSRRLMFTVGNGWEENIVRELDGNWCLCEKPILNHEIEKIYCI